MADSKLQVENPLNQPMHYGYKPEVGVVQAPDKLPTKYLYSGYEQSQIYDGMLRDLYISQKKAPPKSRKTPKIIKIALGLIAARVLYAVVKPPVANAVRRIFHRG